MSHGRRTVAGSPYGSAVVAFAVNALKYQQGRPLAVALYFIAGMAIVYGILAMLAVPIRLAVVGDRKSTRLNSSHDQISYAVFCLKKKKPTPIQTYVLNPNTLLVCASSPQLTQSQ